MLAGSRSFQRRKFFPFSGLLALCACASAGAQPDALDEGPSPAEAEATEARDEAQEAAGPARAEAPEAPGPRLPLYAVGEWTGVLELPSGQSQNVVMAVRDDGGPGLAVGRALYASPTLACSYSMTLSSALDDALSPDDGFALDQRLLAGACIERGRVVLRPLGDGLLIGEWFLPDGTRWLAAGLDRNRSGYFVILDSYRRLPAQVNQQVTFSGVATGQHTIELYGLPAGCSVVGLNPRVVTASEGGIIDTKFQVVCPEDEPPTRAP